MHHKTTSSCDRGSETVSCWRTLGKAAVQVEHAPLVAAGTAAAIDSVQRKFEKV